LRIGGLDPVLDLPADGGHVVSDHRPRNDFGRQPDQHLAHLLTAFIHALAAGTLGTDGQDAGAKPHRSSLRIDGRADSLALGPVGDVGRDGVDEISNSLADLHQVAISEGNAVVEGWKAHDR